MEYTEEELDTAIDKLLIERGEHPERVRNPLYGEERKLAKDLVRKVVEPAKKHTLEHALTLINEAQLIIQSIESGRILWEKQRILWERPKR